MNSNLETQANSLYEETKEEDFIFEYEMVMYRAKLLKSGKIKIKEICTGVPRLIGAENKGNELSPNWHYKFKVESAIHGSVELLLNPNGFSSNLTFKKSIMKKISILFSGNKSDFELFLSREMDRFPFPNYGQTQQ